MCINSRISFISLDFTTISSTFNEIYHFTGTCELQDVMLRVAIPLQIHPRIFNIIFPGFTYCYPAFCAPFTGTHTYSRGFAVRV
ncbi:hypothetical protein CW304_30450 [Bacillus sp. UFRGS-B20]|nr:hypothetical protein CW304_30450 [Bacillus sp. UFRGS-B20]